MSSPEGINPDAIKAAEQELLSAEGYQRVQDILVLLRENGEDFLAEDFEAAYDELLSNHVETSIIDNQI